MDYHHGSREQWIIIIEWEELEDIKLECRKNVDEYDCEKALKYCNLACKQCCDLFNNQLKSILIKDNLDFPLLYLRIDGFIDTKTHIRKLY